MENKELIKNVTYNESGCEVPLEESVISFLQILIPKSTMSGAKDDGPLSYKNCNSFELIYDKRMPKILYYLGDYMLDADAKPSRFFNPLIFDGTTIGGSGDLMESYKACEAIKKWAENTMYLIGEQCVKEINDRVNEEIDKYDEESRKRLLDKLYELGKDHYRNRTYEEWLVDQYKLAEQFGEMVSLEKENNQIKEDEIIRL